MSLLQAIILGFIQGMSEFLPVSSSGHLLVFHHIMGLTSDDTLTFIIVLNMGSLMPLLWVFRKDVLDLIKNPFQKMTAWLIIATLPLIVVSVLFQHQIRAMVQVVQLLPVGFVITGVALLLSDKFSNGKRAIADIKWLDAVLAGLAQACAVFPGLTRSGSTITTTLARGFDRESAAKFSFLMSIPTAFGAIILEASNVFRGNISLEDLNFLNLGAGFVTAAIVGYMAIHFMLGLVKRAKLKYFALYYVFALAAVVFLFF